MNSRAAGAVCKATDTQAGSTIGLAVLGVSLGRGHAPAPRLVCDESSGAIDRGPSRDALRAPRIAAARIAPSERHVSVDRTGRSRACVPAGPRDREVPRRRVRSRGCRRCRRRLAASLQPAVSLRQLRRRRRSSQPRMRRRWPAPWPAADVEYAQAAYRVHTQLVPNDPLYALQWNLPRDRHGAGLGHPAAARLVDRSSPCSTAASLPNAIVRYNARAFAFRRSGVAYPALGADRRAVRGGAATGRHASRFVAPRDFIWDDNDAARLRRARHARQRHDRPADQRQRRRPPGIAFNVRLMPVKVHRQRLGLSSSARRTKGPTTSVARGIRYAADNGAKVINMSIGRIRAAGARSARGRDQLRRRQGRVRRRRRRATTSRTAIRRKWLAEIAPRVDGAVSVARGRPAHRHRVLLLRAPAPYVELAAPGGSTRGFGGTGGDLAADLRLDVRRHVPAAARAVPAPRFDVVRRTVRFRAPRWRRRTSRAWRRC